MIYCAHIATLLYGDKDQNIIMESFVTIEGNYTSVGSWGQLI